MWDHEIDKLKVVPGRAVDESTVEALVKSIQEIGLLHPISVDADTAQVLAGVHRVEAFRRLGRKTIPATIHRLDSLRSSLARIDENLIRNEGTALERAEALRERKELYEQLHPATRHGGDRSSRHGGDLKPVEVVRFTKDTAEKAGMSERTVQRHVAVAEDLDPEAKAEIAGTPAADSITELEELARHPPEEQRELAKQAKAGKPIKKDPRKAMNVEPAEGDDKNERFTPRALIEDLHALYDFTVDASSDPRSPAAQVIGRFWTKKQDGLKQRWGGERIFINPEFDNIEPWVTRVHTEMEGRKPPELVVMLLPAVRTEQRWWQDHVEPYRDGRGAHARAWELETRFLDGRTRFGSPADPEGEHSGSPPFGCVLLIWQLVLTKWQRAGAARAATPGKLVFGLDLDARPGNWKMSSARVPKGHAFREDAPGLGLCGAKLGKSGDMPGSEDPICDRCAELVAQSSSTPRRRSSGDSLVKGTWRRGSGTAHFYEEGAPGGGSTCGRPAAGTVAIPAPKPFERCMTCKAYVERQEAFRVKSPPADDDGKKRARPSKLVWKAGPNGGAFAKAGKQLYRVLRHKTPKAFRDKGYGPWCFDFEYNTGGSGPHETMAEAQELAEAEHRRHLARLAKRKK